MVPPRRRAQRIPIRLAVTARGPKGSGSGRTHDVSRYGARLELDMSVRIGDHLALRLDLGPLERVDVTGTVSYAPEDSGRDVGVEFVMMSADSRARWEEFVNGLEEANEGNAAGFVLPDRRQQDRLPMSLLVWIPTEEGQKQFFTRDISTGGMFVYIPDPIAAGTEVEVVVVHPETEAGYSLRARIVRAERADVPNRSGVALRFVDMTPAREEELLRFLGLPPAG